MPSRQGNGRSGKYRDDAECDQEAQDEHGRFYDRAVVLDSDSTPQRKQRCECFPRIVVEEEVFERLKIRESKVDMDALVSPRYTLTAPAAVSLATARILPSLQPSVQTPDSSDDRYDGGFTFTVSVAMKRAIEIVDLVLKILSCLAILGAGGWALLNFGFGGSTEWQANIAVETQVLPYHDDLRLLVIHVKTKNPRSTKFELTSARHDSYLLHVRRLPDDGKMKATYLGDAGDEWVKPIDLLARAGGDYESLPAAEMDDMQIIVVPAGGTIALTADMERDLGTSDEHGKRDRDSISASAVVHITQ